MYAVSKMWVRGSLVQSESGLYTEDNMSEHQGRLCLIILLIIVLFLPAGPKPYPGHSYYSIGQSTYDDIASAFDGNPLVLLFAFHLWTIPFLIFSNLCLLVYPLVGMKTIYRILLPLFVVWGWLWPITTPPLTIEVLYGIWALPLTATLALLLEIAIVVDGRRSRGVHIDGDKV